jgi:GAF domain-containing protein
MLHAPVPHNELSRLQALFALNILDSSPDVRFDCITRFAAEKLEVPICLITLIDANRQWFKSTCGIETTEIPRDLSICAHAICETTNNHPRGRVYEISDTYDDSRFFDNPQVTGDPWIRSYISFLLQSESGMNIGALCLADTRPRKFDDDEIDLIIELGSMAEDLMNGRGFSNKLAN